MDVYAIILASGNGVRLPNKENLPKQFLTIDGEVILNVTVKQFALSPFIAKTIVVVSEGWVDYTKEVLDTLLKTTNIDIVTGDKDRQGSLLKGLLHLSENYKLNKDDVVLTHDGVRPFISQEVIKENIEALKNGAKGVDTVIPCTDTIVHSENGKDIDNVPLREKLYRGQTPQSFNFYVLFDLLKNMSLQERLSLTDAAKILVSKGQNVAMVMGESSNMKITTPFELLTAECFYIFLKQQLRDEECNATYYL